MRGGRTSHVHGIRLCLHVNEILGRCGWDGTHIVLIGMLAIALHSIFPL